MNNADQQLKINFDLLLVGFELNFLDVDWRCIRAKVAALLSKVCLKMLSAWILLLSYYCLVGLFFLLLLLAEKRKKDLLYDECDR